MPPKLIEVPAPLLALINSGRVVAFLGAGSSMESPAELPSAGELADRLVAAGFGTDGDSLEDVAQAIFDNGGWPLFAQLLDIDDWRARQSNDTHHVLAELAAENLVRWILSTNWDLLSEMALSASRVRYSVFVRPESVQAESFDRISILKLHGCITQPEHFKVTREHMATADWKEKWAEALFEIVVRGNSILFVGYSGSSPEITGTLRTLVDSGERTARDYLVDPRGLDQIEATESGRNFVSALRLTGESACQGGASEFFLALRHAVYPLLLERPHHEARGVLQEIASLVGLGRDALEEKLALVRRSWEMAGQSAAQDWLVRAFAPYRYRENLRPYVPISVHKGELGRWWAWLAVALWAGTGELGGDLVLRVQVPGVGDLQVSCVLAVCPPDKLRAAAASALLASLDDQSDRPGVRYLGVILGGMGAMPQVETSFSVARGEGTASVVRGQAAKVAWQEENELFAAFRPGRSEDAVRHSIREALGRELSSLEGGG